jgi:hypothetical protein
MGVRTAPKGAVFAWCSVCSVYRPPFLIYGNAALGIYGSLSRPRCRHALGNEAMDFFFSGVGVPRGCSVPNHLLQVPDDSIHMGLKPRYA